MYTRVFTSILESSLNCTDVPISARWLWLTLLILADESRTGIVDMPVERLAARAGLTPEQTREGLAALMAPDPNSSSDEDEGRRIRPIRDDSERGWELVNYAKYRAIAQKEHERAMLRQRVKRFRSKRTETESIGPVTERVIQKVTETKSNENVTPHRHPIPSPSPSPPTPPRGREGNGNGEEPRKPEIPTVAEVQAMIDRYGYQLDAESFVLDYKRSGTAHSWQAVLRSFNALRTR